MFFSWFLVAVLTCPLNEVYHRVHSECLGNLHPQTFQAAFALHMIQTLKQAKNREGLMKLCPY